MPPTLFSRPGRPGHGEIKDLLVPAFSRHLVMLLLVNSKPVLGPVGGVPLGRAFGAILGLFLGFLFGASLGGSFWGSWKCLDVFNKSQV